jgi:mRNA interferase MazF
VVKRGDISLAELDPTLGSEIRTTRPCLVVSPPEIHDFLRSLIITPLTTGSHPAPDRIPIRFEGQSGLILLDQIRTVDKRRLLKRLRRAPDPILLQALSILRDMFGT